MLLDEGRVYVGVGKFMGVEDSAHEIDVGWHAHCLPSRESVAKHLQGGGPVGPPDDELSNHRIVEDGDLVALDDTRVHAHGDPLGTRPSLRRQVRLSLCRRGPQVKQVARAREEAGLRPLGVDAGFEGMACKGELRGAAVEAAKAESAKAESERAVVGRWVGGGSGEALVERAPWQGMRHVRMVRIGGD